MEIYVVILIFIFTQNIFALLLNSNNYEVA